MKKEKIEHLNKQWHEFVQKNRMRWIHEYSPSFLRILTTFRIEDLSFRFEEIERLEHYHTVPYLYLHIEIEKNGKLEVMKIQNIGRDFNEFQYWVKNGEFKWSDHDEGKGYLNGENVLDELGEEMMFQKLLDDFSLTEKVEKIAEVLQKEEDEMEAEKLKNQFASLIKKASKQQEFWNILIEDEDYYLELKGDIELTIIKKSDK